MTDDRDSLTLPPPSGRHIQCHNHSIGEGGGGCPGGWCRTGIRGTPPGRSSELGWPWRIRELGRQWWIRGIRAAMASLPPRSQPRPLPGLYGWSPTTPPPQKRILGGSRGSIRHFAAVWRRGHFGALCKRRLLGALWKCVLLGRSGNADSWGHPGSAGMV